MHSPAPARAWGTRRNNERISAHEPSSSCAPVGPDVSLVPALQGMQIPRTWGSGFDYTARPRLGRTRPFAEDAEADEDREPPATTYADTL
jgi:hypothetical protein